MNVYGTKQIRNVVLLGHGGAGKTTVAEALALVTGTTKRMGKVPEGTTISDYDKEEIKKILNLYMSKYYDEADDQQTWFGKIKDMAEELGYAREVKEYKKEPEKWPGHVGGISTVLRVAITRRRNTPDLYEIMHVLGKANVEKRIEWCIK